MPLLTGYPSLLLPTLLANVRTVLRTDPVLTETPYAGNDDAESSRAVTLWLMDGDAEQDDDPPEELVPAVRLTMGELPAAAWTEDGYAINLAFNLDCYTPGRDAADALTLLEATARAFRPTDTARKAEVKAILWDVTYPRGHVSGPFFSSFGSRSVAVGSSRYATKTRLVLGIRVKITT